MLSNIDKDLRGRNG